MTEADAGPDELLRSVMDALPGGLAVIDEHGVIQHINPAGMRVLGARSSPLGRTMASFRPEFAVMRWATDRGEVLLLPESSARHAEELARVIGFSTRELPGEPRRLVVVFNDITEDVGKRRAEARSRRLADVGSLVASIAHEIRNPVFAIQTLAHLLREETVELRYPELAELAQKIEDEARRVARMVDDLLGFARDRDLRVERVELLGLLEQLLEDVRQGIAPPDDGGPVVPIALRPAARIGKRLEWMLDREAVRQIFGNLVRNAVQAVHANESRASTDGVEVRVDFWDEWIEVEVEDRGVGIEPAELPRVFDPFYTRRRKGTGLGLAVVDRLVRQHHGSLTIGSQLGRGTVVTVRFPPGQ